MIRVTAIALSCVLLAACSAPGVPVATAPSQPFLDPLRLEDAGIAFAQPIAVRMQPTGRRDFSLRMRMGFARADDGNAIDLAYRGSVRTAARLDGRTEFAIYVDDIDGDVSFAGSPGAAPGRVQVRERGLSQQVLGSVHNLDNTLHELSLPLVAVLADAQRRGTIRHEPDMARLLALKVLSENLWPLYPVRTARLATGRDIWPTSPREWRDWIDGEMIPALTRSPQFREMFDRLPLSERGGIQDYDLYMRRVGASLSSMFSGSEMAFGGRIAGTRVWNGQDVVEARGPVRATFTVGSGSGAMSARLSGDNHLLVDPYSGITVRTEFSVAARIVLADGRSVDATQQISATVAPPPDRARIGTVPTPGLARVPGAAPQRGDVPDGRTPRRISDIYAASIGSIFTVSAGGNSGSGFAVGRDLVLTNRHVVEGSAGGWVDLVQGGRRVARARVERVFDGAFDLALLRAERPLEGAPLQLARELPAIGTEVLIIGSPVGLEGSITGGIVSQLRPVARASYLQVDAAVNPGNSGGPVFDRLGRVVGIVTARLEPDRAAAGGRPVIGIGFALSSETVLELLASARVSASTR